MTDDHTRTDSPRSATCSDAWVCHAVAAGAGTLLMHLRQGPPVSNLRDEGDRRAHSYIAAAPGRLRPGEALLSEEEFDDRCRLAARRVWIVDPLDGTREFGEAGRTNWAVHLALQVEGTLAAGAVARRALHRTISTIEPPRLPMRPPGRLRLAVSPARPPRFTARLVERLDTELIPMGRLERR